MTVLDVVATLGVEPEEINSDMELIDALLRGLPTDAVDAVTERGILTPREVEELVIPRRTLAHRRQKRQPLTAAESDRLIRIVRIITIANEQFGDTEKAARWLRRPNRVLDGRAPLSLLETGEGARVVEETIMRIAHGIFF